MDVAVIIFGHNKKLYEYSSCDMPEALGRYHYVSWLFLLVAKSQLISPFSSSVLPMNTKDPVILKANATMKMRKTRLLRPPKRCKPSRATLRFRLTSNSPVSNTFTMLRPRLLPSLTAFRYRDMALHYHKVSLDPRLETTPVVSARTLARMDTLLRRRLLRPKMDSHICPTLPCITPMFTPP